MVTEQELSDHLRTHSSSALQLWLPSSTCTWPGCTSKAVFNNESKYKEHLKNIHTKPLICQEPKCMHKTPFRNKGDLNRHSTTAHKSARPYKCPFNSCESRPFSRKDKLIQHIRETVHPGDDFCLFTHCKSTQTTSFTTREGLASHYLKLHCAAPGEQPYYTHRLFTCALGLCSLTSASELWTGNGLNDHLKAHHGIAYWGSIISKATKEGDYYVLRPKHIENYNAYSWVGKKIEWHECTVCSQSQQVSTNNAMAPEMTTGQQYNNLGGAASTYGNAAYY